MALGQNYFRIQHVSPFLKRFNLKHWIVLAIILFIPLLGFNDIIGISLSWFIGILLELIFIMYIII